jgi:shikimate kinase
MPNRNVILIGARGCGKTTIGRALAARLGWGFVDVDEQIEIAADKTIREIFADDGEAIFRRWERETISGLARGAHRQVIAVGGGAVLQAANRAVLRRMGLCIWLTAPATVLSRRIRADRRTATTRPPLTTGRRTRRSDATTEVRLLLAERRPLYAALAQHVVHTGRRSIPEVVRAVLAVLAKHDVRPDED